MSEREEKALVKRQMREQLVADRAVLGHELMVDGPAVSLSPTELT